MVKVSKRIWLVIIGTVLIIVGIGWGLKLILTPKSQIREDQSREFGLVGFIKQLTGIKTGPEQLTEAEKNLFEITPEVNTDNQLPEENLYPTEFQITGKINQLTDKLLTVEKGGVLVEFQLVDDVLIKCLPEKLTAVDGQKVAASEVFMDFSKLSINQEAQLSPADLGGMFNKGVVVTVLGNSVENGSKLAKMIVGYGCKIGRELELEL